MMPIHTLIKGWKSFPSPHAIQCDYTHLRTTKCFDSGRSKDCPCSIMWAAASN